jgi:hypothetical protein
MPTEEYDGDRPTDLVGMVCRSKCWIWTDHVGSTINSLYHLGRKAEQNLLL